MPFPASFYSFDFRSKRGAPSGDILYFRLSFHIDFKVLQPLENPLFQQVFLFGGVTTLPWIVLSQNHWKTPYHNTIIGFKVLTRPNTVWFLWLTFLGRLNTLPQIFSFKNHQKQRAILLIIVFLRWPSTDVPCERYTILRTRTIPFCKNKFIPFRKSADWFHLN